MMLMAVRDDAQEEHRSWFGEGHVTLAMPWSCHIFQSAGYARQQGAAVEDICSRPAAFVTRRCFAVITASQRHIA